MGDSYFTDGESLLKKVSAAGISARFRGEGSNAIRGGSIRRVERPARFPLLGLAYASPVCNGNFPDTQQQQQGAALWRVANARR